MPGALARAIFNKGAVEGEGGEEGESKAPLPSGKASAGKALKEALAGDDYEAIAEAFSTLKAECEMEGEMPMASEEAAEGEGDDGY